MKYPIENKLVIAVASSALFDLNACDKVYREEGIDHYRAYQKAHQQEVLNKGVAFPFIKRFLNINDTHQAEQPVEVILLSRNDPDTGRRVMNSIKEYGLNITRSAFLSGKSPFEYIPSFNVSLFLSANDQDVRKAIEAGFAAGTVMPSTFNDEEADKMLRIAFDFDGVLADDESEKIFHETNDVEKFNAHETKREDIPHNPGPLQGFFQKLSALQDLENKRAEEDPSFTNSIRIAIVTARSAPASSRVVTTLAKWGVRPDETFFLGGMDKQRVLSVMRPHMFFDDQMTHVNSVSGVIPAVHIPFGIKNTQT